MICEWNIDKSLSNLDKHGLDFETASLVFNDEYRIEIFDKKHSSDEDRYITIGMIGDVLAVVFVVYTERGEHIRLISARYANKKERGIYFSGR